MIPGESRALATLILAGGRSRRMGQDKATLELDGEVLVARQVRVIREASDRTEQALGVRLAEPHLSRAAGQVDPVPELDLRILRDREPDGRVRHRGPLAGIVTGLEALVQPAARSRPEALLVLAVDMPGVGPGLLEELVEAWVDAGVDRTVAPRVDGRWEPLCAIWSRKALPEARRRLEAGRRSPSALLDHLNTRSQGVALELPATRSAEFESWNEPGSPGRISHRPSRS